MNLYTLSSLGAFLTCTALSLLVYLRNPKKSVYILFSLGTLIIGVWCLFPFLCSIAKTPQQALVFTRIIYTIALFTPPTFIHFVFAMMGVNKQQIIKKIILIAYIVSLLHIPLVYTPYFIKSVKRFLPYFTVEPGPFYPIFMTHLGIFCSYIVYKVLKIYMSSWGIFRNQIKYVFIAFTFGYSASIIHFAAAYGFPEVIPHDLLIIGYALTLSYAILKYGLMDINIVLQKFLTNLSMGIVFCLAILPLLLLKQSILIKLPIAIVIGFFLSILLPTIKTKTEDRFLCLLMKGRYENLTKLEEFIQNIPFVPDEKELQKKTVETISNAMGTQDVGLFIYNPGKLEYAPVAIIGNITPVPLLQDTEVIKYLKEARHPLIIGELEKLLDPKKVNLILEEIKPFRTALLTGLFYKDFLTGLITLGEKPTKETYTTLELKLLEQLSAQLAVTLDYKRIENDLRKKQEFEAIGIMALEISHEIKNLLLPIKTYFELLPHRYNESEFRETFSKIANTSVEIMNRKVEDILYFGQEKLPQFNKHTDIHEILEYVIQSLKYKAEENNIQLVLEKGKVPEIVADPALLAHTFTNIVLNAIEALKETPNPSIVIRTQPHPEISPSMKEKSETWIRITIEDNGPGMPKKVLNRLFTPFLTTKSTGGQRGTGLGLVVCKKIIDSHNGFIHVASEEGKGTTMIFDLPTTQPMLGFV